MSETTFTIPEGHARLSQADLNRFTFDESGALHINGKRVVSETVLRFPFLEKFWGRVVGIVVLAATVASGWQSGLEVLDRMRKGGEASKVTVDSPVPRKASCHPASGNLFVCEIQAPPRTPSQ